jgi:hypothetical protein
MEAPPSDGRHHLLDAILESWDRSHEILQGLLRACPDAGRERRGRARHPRRHRRSVHVGRLAQAAPDLSRLAASDAAAA